MAAAFTLVDQWHDGKRLNVIGKIILSGSYTSTGDPCDLTGKGILSRVIPSLVHILGRGGFDYRWIPGTDLTNGKVQVRVNDAGGVNAAQAEHTAIGYVAGVTGDTLDVWAVFPFQG